MLKVALQAESMPRANVAQVAKEEPTEADTEVNSDYIANSFLFPVSGECKYRRLKSEQEQSAHEQDESATCAEANKIAKEEPRDGADSDVKPTKFSPSSEAAEQDNDEEPCSRDGSHANGCVRTTRTRPVKEEEQRDGSVAAPSQSRPAWQHPYVEALVPTRRKFEPSSTWRRGGRAEYVVACMARFAEVVERGQQREFFENASGEQEARPRPRPSQGPYTAVACKYL
jgi:hypothetical protein